MFLYFTMTNVNVYNRLNVYLPWMNAWGHNAFFFTRPTRFIINHGIISTFTRRKQRPHNNTKNSFMFYCLTVIYFDSEVQEPSDEL